MTNRTSPRPESTPEAITKEQMKAVLKFMNKQAEDA